MKFYYEGALVHFEPVEIPYFFKGKKKSSSNMADNSIIELCQIFVT